MKQKDIEIGKRYYIKRSFRAYNRNLKPEQRFIVHRETIKKSGIKKYFNIHGQWVLASEIMPTPCKGKGCPCKH